MTSAVRVRPVPVSEEVFERYYEGQQMVTSNHLSDAQRAQLNMDLEPFETRMVRMKQSLARDIFGSLKLPPGTRADG